MKFICLLVFITIISITASAQSQNDSIPDYSNKALWIDMIDNPETNYYEAVKAFEIYFSNHRKPKDEEESKHDSKEKNIKNDTDEEEIYLKSLNAEEIRKYELLKYQVKRFENWSREVIPFVQENGHILTNEERIEIWKKQQSEKKNKE